MTQMRIKLPDGSERSLKVGSTSLDLATDISPSLAKRVVVAKINGELRDLQDPLNDGDQVLLLDHKSPEALEVICHSCEHILAAAVLALFPKVQVTMGPKDHREGFYYDFDIGRPFTDEDLVTIEAKMRELMEGGISFKKKWLNKAEAKALFTSLGQTYKPEIIDWIPDEMVTIYESGSFVDLCRGPHLPNASFIKAFKLLGNSGSYWRGDAEREMLQRVSGIAFADKKDLDQYLYRIEEAKRRDHRKLGPRHELFFVSERFGQWQDPKMVQSEARVSLQVPKAAMANGALNELVERVEQLLSQLQGLFSHGLLVRGINIVPKAEGDEALCDLRVFAALLDSGARKGVVDAIKSFNQAKEGLVVKHHFDSHANEEIGPGLVNWLPQGGRLRSLIEDFSKERHFQSGYDMVYSPHIAKSDLWRVSGHWGFYQESMFAPMNVDGNEYILKPMNCPFHILMYKWKPKSYRDLPVRLAEFGTVYRYELAGVLHGLMRVRGFTQDDAHIFCRWDQLDEELDSVLRFVLDMLKAFGFTEFDVNISTRPAQFVGALTEWEQAETSLKQAIERTGLAFAMDEGGGAFYGPKIDIKLKDCLGRSWQCSTLQLDFNNPERFELDYVNSEGEKQRPVMLHRALFGSFERFIGVLIEHYAGAFPAWLSPEQVRILTISDRHHDHAGALAEKLKAAGIRVNFPKSQDKLSAQVRQAQMDKIPLMVVVGDKEVSDNGGTLRLRSQEDKGFYPAVELVSLIADLCQKP